MRLVSCSQPKAASSLPQPFERVGVTEILKPGTQNLVHIYIYILSIEPGYNPAKLSPKTRSGRPIAWDFLVEVDNFGRDLQVGKPNTRCRVQGGLGGGFGINGV